MQLLAGIRDVFHENTYTRIFSADLIAKLIAMADRPWRECNHGKALTQNGLSRHLKKFGIRPETVRIGDEQAKGFKPEFFADAFKCYLPPFQSVPPYQSNKITRLGEKQSVPETFDGTDANSRTIAISTLGRMVRMKSPNPARARVLAQLLRMRRP